MHLSCNPKGLCDKTCLGPDTYREITSRAPPLGPKTTPDMLHVSSAFGIVESDRVHREGYYITLQIACFRHGSYAVVDSDITFQAQQSCQRKSKGILKQATSRLVSTPTGHFGWVHSSP